MKEKKKINKYSYLIYVRLWLKSILTIKMKLINISIILDKPITKRSDALNLLILALGISSGSNAQGLKRVSFVPSVKLPL